MLLWTILMEFIFLTYLLNEGWTFLLNESVKEKKKKKNGGIFGLRVWQNKALLVT